jgi:uracil-DNA glycosylase
VTNPSLFDEPPDLSALRDRAVTCTACDLYERATQTVFGEGPPDARVVLMGEQPGDQEDRAGRPFVGPAGRILDRALDEAGIDRETVYVTNAVKHFKWRPAGKVRLHQKPSAAQIKACSQWWRSEVGALDPDVVVLLGATAAHAVLGPRIRVTRDRGTFLRPADFAFEALVTIHPSAVLRAQGDDRDDALRGLVDDLRAVAGRL